MYAELAHTLIQLVETVQSPPETGLVVTEAAIELPLEISASMRGGDLVFLASAPHTRWESGFLPPVSRGRLKVALEEN